MKSESESYKQAGVDITAGYRAVELMQAHIRRTKTDGVASNIGGFSGAYALGGGWREPVLISGTDGVGTKLKLAFLLDKHDTVGIDCVAMCVNDILCSGAQPLFFLDYIATGKLVPEKAAQIVKGVADGCIQAEMALIGGETAEMPGFYPDGEYDLAGFAVGVAEKSQLFDKTSARAGDVLLALPSSGVHSNGFSLVRKALDIERSYSRRIDALGYTLGESLITPTRIYTPEIKRLLGLKIRSIAHITGGGFYENVPRSLPGGLSARIERSAVRTPEIFRIIQKAGAIDERDMFNTFNMGVGMTVVIDAADAAEAIFRVPDAYVIGCLEPGEERVVLC